MDKSIIDFLIKAKKKTYAGKGAETIASRKKSHDLIYREDNFMLCIMIHILAVKSFPGKKPFGLQIIRIGV